ncbi:MAG TPA: TolC family protein [Gemmatimonadales bacterium]
MVAQAAAGDTVAMSVADAVQRARDMNPALRAEVAEARYASATALEATSAFLPSLRLEGQVTRTTDPVGAFGLKLRQGRFAGPDLQLDALNDPAAISGFSTAATIELPILATEGLFGYAAAKRGAAARSAGARRAGGATAFLATRAYWDVQLARRKVATLDAAFEAARAHREQAEALRAQGLVTGLDARLADLRAAELEAQLVHATAESDNTVLRLRAFLALPVGVPLVLLDSLTDVVSAGCADGACEAAHRADLDALSLGVDAANLAVRRAWSSQLPQVAAFGVLSHSGRSTFWGSGSGDWTLGIGVRWNVFPALGGIGGVRGARAARDAAEARHEDARRNADVEVQTARRLVDAASQGVGIASRAHGEAAAALDHARLRYRTGAAPITELLDVHAAATAAHLNLLAARHGLLVANAALELAHGVYDR